MHIFTSHWQVKASPTCILWSHNPTIWKIEANKEYFSHSYSIWSNWKELPFQSSIHSTVIIINFSNKRIFEKNERISEDKLYQKRLEKLGRGRIEKMLHYIMKEKGLNNLHSFTNYESFQKDYDILKSNPRIIFSNEYKRSKGNFDDFVNFWLMYILTIQPVHSILIINYYAILFWKFFYSLCITIIEGSHSLFKFLLQLLEIRIIRFYNLLLAIVEN